jgi:hypothetical protein
LVSWNVHRLLTTGGRKPVDRDSERADRVPDADELDVRVRVRVRAAEQLGGDPVGVGVAARVAVERVGVLDPVPVLGPQDAAVAHEPDGAARGERATAEAEEVQLVAGRVVVDHEAVALLHVA